MVRSPRVTTGGVDGLRRASVRTRATSSVNANGGRGRRRRWRQAALLVVACLLAAGGAAAVSAVLLSGVYPAARAARLPPAEALRSTG
jgi:hypothetical protein